MARILFVIKALYGAAGGAERVLATVASGLARRGHTVAVATFDQVGAAPFYSFDDAIEMIPLAVGRSNVRSTVGETIRRISALRGLAGSNDWDVAIGFMHSAYIPLGLALLGTRLPLIASEHISYTHYRTRPIERALLELLPLIAAKTTVVSEAVRATFPRRLREGMTPVTNPVSHPTGKSAQPGSRSSAHPTLLAVGRLTVQKDFELLISVFARLTKTYPDWRLRIVGEGELRGYLQHFIATQGLDGLVTMPGVRQDIGEEYADAEAFVMPSLYESFGLATAEALAHGLPAVGFADDPGSSLLIQPGVNGLLATGSDRAVALEAALRLLMADAALRRRLGSAAPATMVPFMSDAVTDQWDALIAQTVSAKRQCT